MTSEEKVKTVEMARTLSLIKWRKVKEFQVTLFNEFDRNCGFCSLGNYRYRKRHREGDHGMMSCELCGVNERCHEIQLKGSDLEDQTRELIDKTIKFLEDMKVTESE